MLQKARNLMVCGYDTYHEAGTRSTGSCGAFVSTYNQRCSRYFSQAVWQIPGAELHDHLTRNLCSKCAVTVCCC